MLDDLTINERKQFCYKLETVMYHKPKFDLQNVRIKLGVTLFPQIRTQLHHTSIIRPLSQSSVCQFGPKCQIVLMKTPHHLSNWDRQTA